MHIEDLLIKSHASSEFLYSPAMFAKSIGVSENVVRHWMKQGALPLFRIGRRVFINMLVLKQQIAAGQSKISL